VGEFWGFSVGVTVGFNVGELVGSGVAELAGSWVARAAPGVACSTLLQAASSSALASKKAKLFFILSPFGKRQNKGMQYRSRRGYPLVGG